MRLLPILALNICAGGCSFGGDSTFRRDIGGGDDDGLTIVSTVPAAGTTTTWSTSAGGASIDCWPSTNARAARRC